MVAAARRPKIVGVFEPELPLPVNLLPGVEWDALRRLLLKVHDLGISSKVHIRQIRESQLAIACYLALAYHEIRSNSKLETQFNELLDRQARGSDPVRKLVKFALNEAYATEWACMKGFHDMLVGAIHVAVREYLIQPNSVASYETVRLFIESRQSSQGRRGLDACWQLFMDMQRTEARRSRELHAQKEILWAREQARQKQDSDKSEAEKAGISVEDYLRKQDDQRNAEREARKQAAAARVRERLIKNSKTWKSDKGYVGQLLIVDAKGNVRRLARGDEDGLLQELESSTQ